LSPSSPKPRTHHLPQLFRGADLPQTPITYIAAVLNQTLVAQRALFVFIDESGNFDFSTSGTRHFVMAAVITSVPLSSANVLQSLRYKLLAQGRDIQSFHATEDRQYVRDQVFRSMESMGDVSAHVVFCDKRNLSRDIQTDSQLHTTCGRALVSHVLRAVPHHDADSIAVIFDQTLTNKKQGEFRLILKSELKQTAKPFHIYFHRMVTDMNGQIADYLSWSKFVQLERGEERPWMSVMGSLRPTVNDVTGETQ
jgi:hypothetical protein